MSAHIYWRINITQAYYGDIAEWVPKDGSGTTIATTGGTASASSSTFGAAANAFDGNAGTFWGPGTSTPTVASPNWLQYRFASAVDIVSFTLATRNDSVFDAGPVDFDLQYSDDGSTWTTRYSYRGVGWTSAGQVLTFTASNVNPTLGIAWRLLINSIYGTASAALGDITLKDGSGATIATGNYAASASSSFFASSGGTAPCLAFDGNSTTYWAASSSSVPQSIEYRFSGAQSVASFCITPAVTGAIPSSVTLQYSYDDTNWTSVGTFTPTNSPSGQQCFSLGATYPAAASIALSPASGQEGNTYSVTATGTSTHFSAGLTTVSISGSGATVSSVSVVSATSLTFSLALSSSATLGAQTVTITTGAEAPTATFTVLSLKRGDIGWSQIRLGTDGCWGAGAYGQSTDGSGVSGHAAVWGGPDGKTLVDGGAALSGGTVTGVTASAPLSSSGGTAPNITITSPLPVANGGTGTATPGIVAGTNVTVSGTWPNQTISATGGGGGSSSISEGTFASLPGSPSSGTLYLFTDSIYDSAYYDGTKWNYRLRCRVMTPPNEAVLSWMNQGTATDTTTQGGSNILTPVGAASHQPRIRYETYPTAPFTRTLCAKILSTNNSGINWTGGIALSDGTKCLGYGLGPNGLVYQSGPTTAFNANIFVTGGYAIDARRADDLYWLRMDDGVTLAGNRTWFVSYNGIDWIQTRQESNTTFLTPTRIGFYADAYDSGTFVRTWVAHWA